MKRRASFLLCAVLVTTTVGVTIGSHVSSAAGVTEWEWGSNKPNDFGGWQVSDDFDSGCTQSHPADSPAKMTITPSAVRNGTKPAADCSTFPGSFDARPGDVFTAIASVKITSVVNAAKARAPLNSTENQGVPVTLEGSFRGRLKIAMWSDDDDDPDNKAEALDECNVDVMESSPAYVTIKNTCKILPGTDFVKVAWRARRQDVRDKDALRTVYPNFGTVIYSVASGVAWMDNLQLKRVRGN